MNELVHPIQPSRDQVPARQGDPPPPSPPHLRLTALQRAALEKAERQADIIRNVAFPSVMASEIPINKEVGASGFRIYLDKLLKDAGNPTDPIERMMVEQLAMAHHRIGQLHVQVEQARTAEEAKVYSAAAVRLTGEFRRLALAVRLYRQPISTKHFTVVKQQIAYLDQAGSPGEVPLIREDTQQGSKRLGYVPQTSLIGESQAGCGRSAEPALARSADTGRARAAAAGGDEDQALAVFDRPEDCRRKGAIGGERPETAEG